MIDVLENYSKNYFLGFYFCVYMYAQTESEQVTTSNSYYYLGCSIAPYVAQVGDEIAEIPLPQPSEYWDLRCESLS